MNVECKPALGSLPSGSCAVLISRQDLSVAERSSKSNFTSAGPQHSEGGGFKENWAPGVLESLGFGYHSLPSVLKPNFMNS